MINTQTVDYAAERIARRCRTTDASDYATAFEQTFCAHTVLQIAPIGQFLIVSCDDCKGILEIR